MSLQNDRFLKALRREPVDQTPVWIMRQAGRYLPEYRKTRAKAGDFLTLCKTPELACEVTLQPLARFPLDAAIVFSDILTIPDAMGLGLQFMQGEGPQFMYPVRDEQAIKSLRTPDMESLSYVFKAVSTIKSALNQRVPLIGFAGSPWTLACYMIEGHGSKDFHLAKSMLYRRPDLLHVLLEKLTTITIDYLRGQIEAGVDAIMLFDTWGGLLTTPTYPEFSLKYMQKIIQALPNCPSILFTKGGGQWLESMADTGVSALGLDWTVDIKQARERVGSKVALQGNLDPAVLLADPNTIRQETQNILDHYGPGPGHIFNLGHGITPDVPPEHLGALIDAVQSYRVT